MDESSAYSECELKFVRDEGYDPAQAAEICANAEDRFSKEDAGKSNPEEDWGEYWGDK
jgi:hypothetical protein